jgi:5-formyltetrahydrofolate cyclo-ligase
VNESPATDPDLESHAAKGKLRPIMRAKRQTAAAAGAAAALAQHVLASGLIAPGKIVSGYAAVGHELDLQPLLQALTKGGWRTCLPVVAGPKGTPLSFRLWQPGEVLEPAGFGLLVPAADAGIVEPDVLLLPCLAVDASGARLGQGGGYYDATLRILRARRAVLAVACAYAVQRIARVPFEPGDERVDWIATEQGIEPARAG